MQQPIQPKHVATTNKFSWFRDERGAIFTACDVTKIYPREDLAGQGSPFSLTLHC